MHYTAPSAKVVIWETSARSVVDGKVLQLSILSDVVVVFLFLVFVLVCVGDFDEEAW